MIIPTRNCLECKLGVNGILGSSYIICMGSPCGCYGFICRSCLESHLTFHELAGGFDFTVNLGMPEEWIKRMLPGRR